MPPRRSAPTSQERLAESSPLSSASSSASREESSAFSEDDAKKHHRRVEDFAAEVDSLKTEAAALRQQVEELTAKLAFQKQFEMSKDVFDELVDLRWETSEVTLAEEVALLREENLALKRQMAEFNVENTQVVMTASKELTERIAANEQRQADIYERSVAAMAK